jgi:hypothetical protein
LPFREFFFGAAFLTLFLATGAGVIAAGSTSKAESESSGTNGSELGDVSVASAYLQRSLSHLPESLIAFHTTDPEVLALAGESIAGSALALHFMFFTLGGMLSFQINTKKGQRQ